MNKNLSMRMWEPGDYPAYEAWHRARAVVPPPAAILPRCGVVVLDPDPAAAMFLYMENSGVGVCFLEHVASRPGLPVGEAREALVHGMRCMKALASSLDYGVMICNTLPAIARTLRQEGWERAGKNEKVTMITTTRGGV